MTYQTVEEIIAERDALRAELDALNAQKEQVHFCRVEDAKRSTET